MPRPLRNIVGGYAYHVLNRANGRLRLFRKDADFAAFENLLAEAHERLPLRILAYTVMSNHWHFIVWPKRGHGEKVSDFFRWFTLTHSQRWHAHHGTSGMGHVYQGRFKSFPIASDEHLLATIRYVERNPLRAGLVRRAEDWRWGSLHRRVAGTSEERALLAEPPTPLGRNWVEHVNEPQSEAEELALQTCIARGKPFGSEQWTKKVARQLSLESTLRPRGRPRIAPAKNPPTERQAD
jgi:putative transposase